MVAIACFVVVVVFFFFRRDCQDNRTKDADDDGDDDYDEFDQHTASPEMFLWVIMQPEVVLCFLWPQFSKNISEKNP